MNDRFIYNHFIYIKYKTVPRIKFEEDHKPTQYHVTNIEGGD